jgi:hypothetical protein
LTAAGVSLAGPAAFRSAPPDARDVAVSLAAPPVLRLAWPDVSTAAVTRATPAVVRLLSRLAAADPLEFGSFRKDGAGTAALLAGAGRASSVGPSAVNAVA